MKLAHSRGGEFRKVGENLYRYSSSGVYYARFRSNGKSIHRSCGVAFKSSLFRAIKSAQGLRSCCGGLAWSVPEWGSADLRRSSEL